MSHFKGSAEIKFFSFLRSAFFEVSSSFPTSETNLSTILAVSKFSAAAQRHKKAAAARLSPAAARRDPAATAAVAAGPAAQLRLSQTG